MAIDTSASAADKLFNIFELTEHLFTYFEPKDLLLATRINTTARGVIQNSLKLRVKLVLAKPRTHRPASFSTDDDSEPAGTGGTTSQTGGGQDTLSNSNPRSDSESPVNPLILRTATVSKTELDDVVLVNTHVHGDLGAALRLTLPATVYKIIPSLKVIQDTSKDCISPSCTLMFLQPSGHAQGVKFAICVAIGSRWYAIRGSYYAESALRCGEVLEAIQARLDCVLPNLKEEQLRKVRCYLWFHDARRGMGQ